MDESHNSPVVTRAAICGTKRMSRTESSRIKIDTGRRDVEDHDIKPRDERVPDTGKYYKNTLEAPSHERDNYADV
jgi:hypothetical protein